MLHQWVKNSPFVEKEDSHKFKSTFKAVSTATSAVVSLLADVRAVEERHRFRVDFKNKMNDSTAVNIYWISHEGKELLKKENLAFKQYYTTNTYYSHPWVFRRSGDGGELMAYGNGIQDFIFEGEKFLAIPNEKMLVLISESKS